MKKLTNFTMVILFCAAVGACCSPLAHAADKASGKRNFSKQAFSKSQTAGNNNSSKKVSQKLNSNATTTKLNNLKSTSNSGTVVVRDHRTPNSSGAPVIRDHRGQAQQQQVVPLTSKNTPAVVRDHRTATWDPIVHPKQPGGGKPQPGGGKPKPNVEIRDHRSPKSGDSLPWKPVSGNNPPPLASGSSKPAGTSEPFVKPQIPNPFGNNGNSSNGNKPEIRDHRSPKEGSTPWQPTSGNNPPPLGTGTGKPPVSGEPVVPPKRPLDGIKGPLGGVFDQGKPPVADPLNNPPQGNPPQGNPPQNPQPGHDKHDKHRGFPYWLLLLNQNRPFGNAYYCDPYANVGFGQNVVVNDTVYVEQPVAYTTPAVATSPVVTAAAINEVAAELPQLAPGAEVMVAAANLGSDMGQAMVQIGDVSLPVEVIRWDGDAATVRVPMMLVAKPTMAQLFIVRADGSLARSAGFQLTPPAPQRL